MEGNLCWNCGRLSKCCKQFVCGGRPLCQGECTGFVEMPNENSRFTHKDMAEALGISDRQIRNVLATPNGISAIIERLAAKGIVLKCERSGKQIHFFMK